jgi:hypothetical protein
VKTAFEKAIETAAQGVLLLQHEMTDIAQRNANASFYFFKETGRNQESRRDFGLAYWRNQFDTLMEQAEERRRAVDQGGADIAEPIEAHVASL